MNHNQNSQNNDKLQSLVYFLSGLLFALVLLEKSLSTHPPKPANFTKDLPFLYDEKIKEIPQKAKERFGLKNIGKDEIPILDVPKELSKEYQNNYDELQALKEVEEFFAGEDIPVVDSNIQTQSPHSVSIYFIKFFGKDSKANSRLVQVQRIVPKNQDPILFILNELKKGPNPEEKAKGVLNALPENFSFSKDYKLNNGILQLDLSSSFEIGGGPQVLKDRLDQLTYSLIGVAGIRAIQITIQNKKVSYLGGDGVPVPEYLTKSDRRVTTL